MLCQALSNNSEEDQKKKQDQFIGILIGYYSSCFELRNILPLEGNAEKILKSELQDLMKEKRVRDKWDNIQHFYSKEFIKYINDLRGL